MGSCGSSGATGFWAGSSRPGGTSGGTRSRTSSGWGMNSASGIDRSLPRTARAGRRRITAAAWLLALAVAGCDDPSAVQVRLLAQQAPLEPLTVREINAQVSGPLDGLQFRWFAVAGECTPQESDQPKTVFRFQEGVREDKVSVEVWRDGKRVAQGDLKVKFDAAAARKKEQEDGAAQIEITT